MEHMLYAKSISWFDDCRIPFIDGDTTSAGKRTCNIFETEYKSGGNGSPDYITDSRGRFPSNILVSDDMLNDGIVRKGFNGGGGPTRFANATGGKKLDDYNYYGDKGSSSRYYDIDKWFEKLFESCE